MIITVTQKELSTKRDRQEFGNIVTPGMNWDCKYISPQGTYLLLIPQYSAWLFHWHWYSCVIAVDIV